MQKLVPTKHNESPIKIPVTVRRSISKLSQHEKIGDCEQSKRKMDCDFDRKQPESHVFQIIMRTRLSDSIDISQIAVKSTATHLQLIIIIKINEISLTFDIPPNFTSNGPVGIVEMALKIYKKVINTGEFFLSQSKQVNSSCLNA